jgi:hypothetical protein
LATRPWKSPVPESAVNGFTGFRKRFSNGKYLFGINRLIKKVIL